MKTYSINSISIIPDKEFLFEEGEITELELEYYRARMEAIAMKYCPATEDGCHLLMELTGTLCAYNAEHIKEFLEEIKNEFGEFFCTIVEHDDDGNSKYFNKDIMEEFDNAIEFFESGEESDLFNYYL